MLSDPSVSGFSKVYVACGYTDLRKGIEGLAALIQQHHRMDSFQKNGKRYGMRKKTVYGLPFTWYLYE